MRKLVALALALSALPAAAATAQDVLIASSESASFPSTATMALDVSALFAPDTDALGALAIEAARVSVHVAEDRVVPIRLAGGSIVTRSIVATWSAEDVRIQLADGDHSGWLAMEPSAGSSTLLAGASTVSGSQGAWYGNTPTPTSGPSPAYHRAVEDEHLAVEGGEAWTMLGDVRVILYGPDFSMATSVNTTSVATGDEPGRTSGQRSHRWVSLELEDARVVTSAAAAAAARSGSVTWTGEASFGARARPAAEPATASLTPSGDGGVAARFGERDVAAAGTAQAPTPNPRAAIAMALVAVALGGAAGYAVVRRRERALDVDALARIAATSADEGRYHDALVWTRRARAQSPTSRRLKLDEADFTALAGDPARALTLLEALAPGPDVDIRVARILAADPGREAAAAGALVRALSAAPELVLEVEGTPLVARLAVRRDVRGAMIAARAAMEKP